MTTDRHALTRARRAIGILAVLAGITIPAGAATAVAVVPDGGFVVSGSTTDILREIDVAHDAGARWVSLSTNWESLEPQPDGYRTPGGPGSDAWATLEARLAYARSKSMNIELRLQNAPQWASGRAGSDDPPTPGHLADYAGFLTDLGSRLGTYIDAYSPWNEPNRAAFWNPVDPDAFTALQKVAYPAIKASDPTAKVLYGPVVGRYAQQNSGYTFLRRSYELGAKGSFDAIGWNGYPGGPPESSSPVENGVPAANTLPAQLYLRGLIDQFDPGRKVWIMEFGWSTCVSCDVSAANGVSEAQQADYLTRAFDYRRRYLSGLVERMFWYQLRDTGTDRGAWEQNEGVLRHDFSAKPAVAAFRALGIDDPDGVLPPGSGGPGAGVVPPATLPPAAAKLALPAKGSSATGGRVVLGRPTLRLRKGIFTLAMTVSVKGGRTALRVDGFRARKWRLVTTVRVPRSGRLTLRVRDTGFVGFRVRATVPGRRGYRVGRVVRVPAKFLRVSQETR